MIAPMVDAGTSAALAWEKPTATAANCSAAAANSDGARPRRRLDLFWLFSKVISMVLLRSEPPNSGPVVLTGLRVSYWAVFVALSLAR